VESLLRGLYQSMENVSGGIKAAETVPILLVGFFLWSR
jgi:hypothetical protein